MALLIVNLDRMIGNAQMWRDTFAAQLPDLEVRIWPDNGDVADIDLRFGQWLAVVQRLKRGQTIAARLYATCDGSQIDGPLGAGGALPIDECSGRRLHRAIDIGGAARLNLDDRFLRRRIDDRQSATASAAAPAAVDIELCA